MPNTLHEDIIFYHLFTHNHCNNTLQMHAATHLDKSITNIALDKQRQEAHVRCAMNSP